MDKNKKILLISIISIVSLVIVIGFGISTNKPNDDGDKILANSNLEEATEEDTTQDGKVQEEEKLDVPEEKEGQSNNTDESNVETDNKEVAVEDDPENQPPPAEPNGADLGEFEKKLKEFGYSYFEDKCYDFFENETSIAFVEIQDNGVKFTLKNKEKISHDAIKKAIVTLLPNESEELFKIINGSVTELAISLDNRTASIEVKQGELYLFISN